MGRGVKCDTVQASARRSPLRAPLVVPFLYASLLTMTALPADVLVSSALLADSRLVHAQIACLTAGARSGCVVD